MMGWPRRYILAFMAIVFLSTPAFAGEEIIWEGSADGQDFFLDPADYPNDALYKAFKANRDARKRTAQINKSLAEGRYSDAVGGSFKDCDDCPEMVVVPAGNFRMGDLNGDGRSDEQPVHEVTIASSFAVGKYEVTQAQWRSVMGNNPSEFSGDNNPIEKVSWNDAKEFINKLNAKTGLAYRLLTESEWEYVARAGATTKYSWGNSIGRNKASCDGCGSRWDINHTAPVGSFNPNSFGLYDMHGNVSEWVEDCYKDSYSGAPVNGSATAGRNLCKRNDRGGSYLDYHNSLRAAARDVAHADARVSSLGLRLARTL